MKISVITPTYQREADLLHCYELFKAQTWPDKEWLILDDSPEPSLFFLQLTDPAVHYQHTTTRQTVGEKRNYLCAKATGDLIAHFDDDDFYTPQYLESMVGALGHHDFVKLSAWYLYNTVADFWGYFDPLLNDAPGYHIHRDATMTVLPDNPMNATHRWGYGFSYMYRKALWDALPFEPRNFGEDHTWILEHVLPSPFSARHIPDTQGLVLHRLHGTNASEAFPQKALTLEEVPPHLRDAVINRKISLTV